MGSIPVGSWHSCAGLVIVTEFGPCFYDCTRHLLWLVTELRNSGLEKMALVVLSVGATNPGLKKHHY